MPGAPAARGDGSPALPEAELAAALPGIRP